MRNSPIAELPVSTGRFKPLVSLKNHLGFAMTLIVLISGLGAVAAFYLGQTFYVVGASVLITPKYAPNLEEKAADFDRLGSIEYAMYIKQQQNLLAHPRIVKKMMEKTKGIWKRLPDETEQDALKRFRAGLSTANKRGEPFINITLRSQQGEGLDTLLNTMVDIYLQESRADTLYDRGGRITLLQQEVNKLSKLIEQQQKRRTEIAQKLGVTTFNENNLIPYDTILVDSTSAYKTARRARIEAQARLHSVDQSPTTLETLVQEAVATDSVLTSFKAKLIEQRTELQNQLLGLTPQHPSRIPVEEEIAKINRDIAMAEQTLAQEVRQRLLDNRQAEIHQSQQVESALLEEMGVQREQANQYASLYNEALILNKQIERLQKQVDKMSDRIDLLNIESDAPGFVRLGAKAVPNTEPVTTHQQILLLSLVAAIALGLTTPLVIDLLDQRIRTPAEVHKILGFAPLVWIVEWFDRATEQLALDQFRRLALTLDRDRRIHHSRCFALTAVKAGGGTTTLTLQLANCLSELGIRTLAVEFNAFKPDSRYQGEFHSLGLSALLATVYASTALSTSVPALEELIVPADENLPVRLPVGPVAERHLVTYGKLPALLNELGRYYDLILLDSPPILLSADTELLSEISGGILLVVEAGQTLPGELKRAARLLERLSPPVVATVVNRVRVYRGGGYFAELLNEYTTGNKPKRHWLKRFFWK